MPSTSTSLFFFFFSLLLLFTFFFVNPNSIIHSSLLSKPISFNTKVNPSDDQIDSKLIPSYESAPSALVKVPKPLPTVDETDVVVLTRNNLTEFISSNKYVMVTFYAPWCYWSRRLLPEYSAAATMLKNTSDATLAKVDCTVEDQLCRDYNIQGYPTMELFVRGIKKDAYYSDRTRDAIATWMKQKMIPAVHTVKTAEEAQYLLSTKWKFVFGFLNSLEDSFSEELFAVSKLHEDIEFYQTTNVNIARLFGVDEEINPPALFWLRRKNYRMNHSLYSFDGEFTSSAMSEFVSIYKLPPMIPFRVEKARLVFGVVIKQLWLFSPKSSWQSTFAFKRAAIALRGKLLFVYVETGRDDAGRLLSSEFSVAENVSRVVAYYPRGGFKKHIYSGELSFSGIMSFAEQFLEDKLEDEKPDKLQLPTHSDDPTGEFYGKSVIASE